MGNRYWHASGHSFASTNAAAGSDGPIDAATDQRGFWARVQGTQSRSDPHHSTADGRYDTDSVSMQIGIDRPLREGNDATLIGGLNLRYVHGRTSIRSPYDAAEGSGRIRTDGYGLGGSLTWYGKNGVYVDGQAQATWYRSDLSYAGGARELAKGNDGFGYALSVEGGKRIGLDDRWSLTPQAQLTYSNARFDAFTDRFGAHVDSKTAESLQSRLGVSIDYEKAHYEGQHVAGRTHLYGIANLYYELTGGTKVAIAGTTFTNEKDRWAGGIGIGGSYNWSGDRYSIYGEGLVKTGLSDMSGNTSWQGIVGMRIRW